MGSLLIGAAPATALPMAALQGALAQRRRLAGFRSPASSLARIASNHESFIKQIPTILRIMRRLTLPE
jgi:hypothetical protein